ncbi:MAG: GNAT family N-acetyltransferase [Aestuariivirgaceae bacterium]|nr:GNAT family N-acetyltransferase [Aestuariivirgaceae bacterium]
MAEFRQLVGAALESRLGELAAIMARCVDDGASIGFLRPMEMRLAHEFWRGVAQSEARGERLVFGAFDGESLLGSVQLILAQMPNQPHRADISKLIVNPKARRQGLARGLMELAETAAVKLGRRLLTLDTATEDAASLYRALGYQFSGRIPDYALSPDGVAEATEIYYKLV